VEQALRAAGRGDEPRDRAGQVAPARTGGRPEIDLGRPSDLERHVVRRYDCPLPGRLHGGLAGQLAQVAATRLARVIARPHDPPLHPHSLTPVADRSGRGRRLSGICGEWLNARKGRNDTGGFEEGKWS